VSLLKFKRFCLSNHQTKESHHAATVKLCKYHSLLLSYKWG